MKLKNTKKELFLWNNKDVDIRILEKSAIAKAKGAATDAKRIDSWNKIWQMTSYMAQKSVENDLTYSRRKYMGSSETFWFGILGSLSGSGVIPLLGIDAGIVGVLIGGLSGISIGAYLSSSRTGVFGRFSRDAAFYVASYAAWQSTVKDIPGFETNPFEHIIRLYEKGMLPRYSKNHSGIKSLLVHIPYKTGNHVWLDCCDYLNHNSWYHGISEDCSKARHFIE